MGGKIPMLSVVIPTYNEEARIGKTLHQVISFLKTKNYSSQIIIVDDGSDDRTCEVVRRFRKVRLISYAPNRGKGFAVRTGLLAAKGALVLFSDADLST